MRKTVKSLIAACTVAAIGAAGCGTTSENSGQVHAQDPTQACKGPDAHYTIGMSQANLAEPYRVRMDEDIRKAAEKVPQFEVRSEEHTSELQSRENLVCRLLLEKKK